MLSDPPELDDEENQLMIVEPTEEKVDGAAVVAFSGLAVVVCSSDPLGSGVVSAVLAL